MSNFNQAYLNLSTKLFTKLSEENKNVMLSPLSIMQALAMCANGASNETLKQIEEVISGSVSISALNKLMLDYVKNLPTTEETSFHNANSIWINELIGKDIDQEFIDTNMKYYSGEVNVEPFNSITAKKINDWVSNNTQDMIEEIIDDLDPMAMMVLVNALAFDGKWNQPFDDVISVDFNNIDGSVSKVDMLAGEEDYYIETDDAVGFRKSYDGDGYSFIALLPKGDIKEYVSSLSVERIINVHENTLPISVECKMPKFKNEYSLRMNELLMSLGIKDAFDASIADFSKMRRSRSRDLYISEVLHKTYIDVNEVGTKAAAVTGIMVRMAAIIMDPKKVVFDRPFMYMIVDSKNDLPLFIGVVNEVK